MSIGGKNIDLGAGQDVRVGYSVCKLLCLLRICSGVIEFAEGDGIDSGLGFKVVDLRLWSDLEACCGAVQLSNVDEW